MTRVSVAKASGVVEEAKSENEQSCFENARPDKYTRQLLVDANTRNQSVET